MKNRSTLVDDIGQVFQRGSAAELSGLIDPSPGALQRVTPDELEELQHALSKGMLPADFEVKLTRLAGDSILHQFVEQNCRLFAVLLLAAHHSSFAYASPPAQERLLRVLAYVRKEEDEIADYKPNGFDDDLREVRAATKDLSGLLQIFKTWRLRHQVPGMWPQPAPDNSSSAWS